MPRKSLITIYKSFIISKFDYCGIIYGEAYNAECKPLVKVLLSSKAKKFIWPKASSFFTCHKLKEVKLIKKLWIGISYLQDHKLKHSFQGCLSLICSCGIKFETTVHYLFRCPNYLHERKTPLDNIKSIFCNILGQNDTFISNVLLFGDTSLKWLFRYNYLKYNS